MADRSQQTEQPTPRRIEKARREGRFAASRDFVSAVQFLLFVLLLAAFGAEWLGRFRETVRHMIERAFDPGFDAGGFQRIIVVACRRDLLPLGAGAAAIAAVTVAAQLGTTRFGLSAQKLAPDFKRLNPVARLRELPRQNWSLFTQALVLLPVFAGAVYLVIRQNLEGFYRMPFEGVEAGVRRLGLSLVDLLWKAALVFLVAGAADLWRQHRRYLTDLRMSKQEIREEAKEVEGNPQVRGRIRRLQRDLLRRRMMHQVPKATAVIVNPTHFAVAIRYRLESAAAPKVVAKGKNYLARRIREKAIAHQIPVVENPPLAQALYQSTEVGQEIPPHLYRAVAEILAYIYRIMNGRLPGE